MIPAPGPRFAKTAALREQCVAAKTTNPNPNLGKTNQAKCMF